MRETTVRHGDIPRGPGHGQRMIGLTDEFKIETLDRDIGHVFKGEKR